MKTPSVAAERGRRSRVLAPAVVAMLLIAFGPPVAAEVVTWPTYVRVAPGRDATVIGELERAKPVTVEACSTAWCRVTVDGVTGYVDREHVGSASPATRFDPAASKQECFAARRAGHGDGQPLALCPLQDATSPSNRRD